MSDGTVRIDTKLDESGLSAGLRRMGAKMDGSMRNLLKSSDSTAKGITRSFDDAWKNMSPEEAARLTQATIDRMGSAFLQLKGAAQQAALKETFELANPPAEKFAKTIEKKAAPATRRMSVYGHGLTRIINAMIPGMYRVRRASVGFAEAAHDMQAATTAGNGLAGVLKALPAIMGTIVAVLALALFALIRWAQKFTDTLYKDLSVTSAMRDRVTQLKGAFDTLNGTVKALGATLLNALAPVLLKIIDWLVKAINWLSMFIAALTGQKTVMRYISGATDSAASSTGKLAKNTKDLEKAAEGALAAFDEIDVLQMEKEDTDTGTVGGNIVMQEVPVEKPAWMEKMLGWWETLKEGIGAVWNWIWVNVLEPIWNWLSQEIAPRALTILIETFGLLKDIAIELWNIISPILIPALTWLWEEILQPIAQWTGGAIINILDWIIGLLKTMGEGLAEGGLKGMFQALFDYVGETFKKLWEDIKVVWDTVSEWFGEHVIDPIVSFFKTAWENIKTFFSNAKIKIQEIWGTVAAWFSEHVIDPIKDFFESSWETISRIPGDAWEYIKMVWREAVNWFRKSILLPIQRAFETVFSGIETFIKNIINSIIDFLNGMINGITTGINTVISGINSISVTIPDWVPVFGGNTWGMNIPTVTAPQIPRLATGAVIPPNSEFAAILGDQRTGRNIEAPEGLIRQIIQEEIGNIQTDVEIKFGGSLGSLVRELKPYIDKENTRIGGSLVKGSIA